MWNRITGVITCVLLGANLAFLLVRPTESRPAFGQAAATPDGTAILATVQGTGNEPIFVLYEVASKRAGAYAIKSGGGIELRGIRELTWDLQIQEIIPQPANPPSVATIREQIEKRNKGKK